MIDDGPLSPFQGRSSSASSFHASLLQAIDVVMSLALCSHIIFYCLKLLNTLDLPRRKPLVRDALPASLSAWSFPFIPACLGQYNHRSSRRWMSTSDTFQSGFPFHFSLFIASSLKHWSRAKESLAFVCVPDAVSTEQHCR